MRDAQTHDYTRREWGHDYAIMQVREGGQELTAMGWGVGITTGHYLILPHNDTHTRYRVNAITYYCDPPDMWRADLVFAPRD